MESLQQTEQTQHIPNNETEMLYELENTQTLFNCFGIVYSLIGLTGLVGNGLVVYVFTRSCQLQQEGTNSLILSLAINDLMISLCQFIPAYSAFVQQTTWFLGSIGCDLYGVIIGFCSIVSILTIFITILSRLCLISGFHTPWLTTVLTCKCVWGISFLLICPSFMGWTQYSLEGLEISCTIDWKNHEILSNYFYITLYIFGLISPMILLVATYVGIHRIGFQNQLQQQPPANVERTHSMAINIFSSDESHELSPAHPPTQSQLVLLQMTVAVLFCFIICWLPYTIVNAITQFSRNPISIFSSLAVSVTSSFAKLNVMCNPIIYSFLHPEFLNLLLHPAPTDDRRKSTAVAIGVDDLIRRPSSNIPNSRVTPSNSVCHSHQGISSPYTRRHDSRSGSSVSETARSCSIASGGGGRRPTICSNTTFRQNRTNSSCSSGSTTNNHPSIFQQVEEPSQWRQDWVSRTSQEMLLNRFGWAIQKKPSTADCSSSGNSSTLFSPSRHIHSKLTAKSSKSSIQSGHGMTKLNCYSEPDLPRFNDRIIKNSGLIPLAEYKRRKKAFWEKSLFLSENCLEKLCSEHKFQKRGSTSSTITYQKRGSTSSTRSTTCTFTQKNNGFAQKYNDFKEKTSRRSSRTPSPTNSQTESFLPNDKVKYPQQVSNILEVPTEVKIKPILSNKYHNGPPNTPSRSKSMRTTRSGSSKFLELPSRFKRHSDGGVYSTSNHENHRQLSLTGREREKPKEVVQRNSVIVITSPCGDTASVKLENLETSNDVDSKLRKLSEISSNYQTCRSGSKKLSFELGTKNEWKYALIHQKECCECASSKGCYQDQYGPSVDMP